VSQLLIRDMLDVLRAVRPRPVLPGNPNQVSSSLNLPGSVGIVVKYLQTFDMLDALHAVPIVPRLPNLPNLPRLPNLPIPPILPRNPNQAPRRLDLPGSVVIAAIHFLLLRRDMFDALGVVVFFPKFVLNLPRNLSLSSNLNLLSSLSLSRNLFLPGHLDLPGSV
jgi:hypothetical protein